MKVLARDIRVGEEIANVHGEFFKVAHIERTEHTTLYHFYTYPVDRPRAGTFIFTRDFEDHVEVNKG